jgi:hypothetical protein
MRRQIGLLWIAGGFGLVAAANAQTPSSTAATPFDGTYRVVSSAMSGPDAGAAQDRSGSGAVYQRHKLPAQRNGRAARRAGDASIRARRLSTNRDKS